MTLRNAFEGLGTESTLKRILKAVSFIKDPNGRMRVVIDNTSTSPVVVAQSGATAGVVNAVLWANAGVAAGWYTQGGPNSVDAREQLRYQMRGVYEQRRSRWTF